MAESKPVFSLGSTDVGRSAYVVYVSDYVALSLRRSESRTVKGRFSVFGTLQINASGMEVQGYRFDGKDFQIFDLDGGPVFDALHAEVAAGEATTWEGCLLYTSPSPRD